MFQMLRWSDYVLLGAISLYLLVIAGSLPLNYDESYNLQVPLTLLKEQKYDTIYHARPFDGFTTITTGPTVLIPTFFVFKFFSIGLLRARIVQYLYVVALVYLFWTQSVKHYTRIISLALLLTLYSIPTQLRLGLSVLGELPAIFFVFLGMTIWSYSSSKYQKISIGIMGLSVITKLYFGMILIPLLIWITIRAFQTKKPNKDFIKEFLIAAFLFLLPFLLWELIKFLYLGYSSYLSYLTELMQFIGFQQVSLENNPTLHQYFIDSLGKFTIFSEGIFPGMPQWITWVFMGGIVVTGAQKIRQGVKDENILATLSFLIFITYLLWFLFMSSLGWWRYIYPFSILFLFLLGDFIDHTLKLFRWPIIKCAAVALFSAVFVFYVVPYVIHQHEDTQTFSETLKSQRQFADEVKSYREKGYKIGVDGWWQAPEISFLGGGIEFFQFTCGQEYDGRYLLIYTALEESIVPVQASVLRECLGQKVFESEDGAFSLYRPIR